MSNSYQSILNSQNKKLLAILIDPDKEEITEIKAKILKINASKATHIFVGGSTDPEDKTGRLVIELKKLTELPVIIFPGDINQISSAADAILLLSLISGRNPEYLIEKQVQAVPRLVSSGLETIPTGYILIESGMKSAVQRVSKTKPLSREDIPRIISTAKAGELLGMRLIYLEAGSGASQPISSSIIKRVKQALSIPLIVGGGIKSEDQLEAAYRAGADLVVVGTAFEQNMYFFEDQKSQELHLNQ